MNRAILTYPLAVAMVVAAAATAYLVRQPTDNQAAAKAAGALKPEAARGAAVLVGDVSAPAEETKTIAEERGQFLETIGTLTPALYFQTHLNIGFIADGKANGTYSDKDARQALDSALSVLESTERRLEALDKVALNKDARNKLEQLQAVSALLRQQSKELRGYWESGKEKEAAEYENLRKNARRAIHSLMGFGQESTP